MNQTLKLTTVATIAAIGSALAGPAYVEAPTPAAPAGDWCNSLKTFGKFHSDSNAQFIQELKFFGRMQWQYAGIDGEDANGDSFDNDFTEFRRVRVGAQVKFLNNFTLKGNVNLVEDEARGGGGESLGYQSFDELHLSYKMKDVLGLDTLTARYGRHKIDMGHESRTSSKKIKTVERSAISNTIYGPRYTGLKLIAEKGDWIGTFGVLSLDDNDAIGGWSHGTALYASSQHQAFGGDVAFDVLYNLDADGSGDDEVGVGYEWAASGSYETEVGNWNLMVNAIIGDHGDDNYSGANRDGLFYGLVVMPSTYIIEDTLEFVARYQYQGSSESEGVRTNSRYFRADDNNAAVNSGRGDSHHSLYAGLNYFLCGHNSKIMTGLEYETLDTPIGDANATTLWAAYRMYF
ncbi:MAG: porin [Akkermansiaceae bacterium]